MNQLKGKFQKKLLPILLLLLGTGFVYGQSTTVSGNVKDADTGEPLIGVSISLQNSTSGGISDYDGNFSIILPQPEGTLQVSYVGYLSQTIKYSGETSLEINLEVDLHGREEVVVVGYGIVSRVLRTTVQMARKEGLKVGLLRPITLWPFPTERISALCGQARKFVVAEMSNGQMG